MVLHNGIVAVGGCQDAAGRAVVGTAGVLLLVDSVADAEGGRGGPVKGDVMDAARGTHEDEGKKQGSHCSLGGFRPYIRAISHSSRQ